MITDATPVLREEEWQSRVRTHAETLAQWVTPHLDRHARGEKHPVYDFLFEYYSFPAAKLARWVPGPGRWLEGDQAHEFLGLPGFEQRDGCVGQPLQAFPKKRQSSLRWVLRLLQSIEGRPPRFGCFGLHEWAMVYDEKDVRHPGLPLRLSPEERRQVVKSLPLSCSHFDAFRFFSAEAQPLNRWPLGQESRLSHEQGGCVHVTMDLYKWAYKFYPWVAGDLLARTFLLAMEARELDMRASPYDVQSLGLDSILIEETRGREVYQSAQQALATKGQDLRRALIQELSRLPV